MRAYAELKTYGSLAEGILDGANCKGGEARQDIYLPQCALILTEWRSSNIISDLSGRR